VLTERLRREGRYNEAFRQKDEIIRELRDGGMKRKEAGDEAWRRMAAEFPPLAARAAPESTAPPTTANPSAPLAESSSTTPVPASTGVAGDTPIPVAWGTIPDTAPLGVEVEWAHQNRSLVVEDRPGGQFRLRWDRARSPAPSYGAISLMEFAATNRKGFMDLVVRVKPTKAEADAEEPPVTARTPPGGWGYVKDIGLEDVEQLLREVRMSKKSDLCPHCGKSMYDKPDKAET
jgi:hypothetical protein